MVKRYKTFNHTADLGIEVYGDNKRELFTNAGVSLFELIDAFKRIAKRVSAEEFLHITVDKISVKSRISQIVDLLEGKDSVTFEALFEGQFTKSQIIVTFLAVLEMAKSQLIRIMQHRQTGIIRIFHG